MTDAFGGLGSLVSVVHKPSKIDRVLKYSQQQSVHRRVSEKETSLSRYDWVPYLASEFIFSRSDSYHGR